MVKRNLIHFVHRFSLSVNLQIVFLTGHKIANMISRNDRFPISYRLLLICYIGYTKYHVNLARHIFGRLRILYLCNFLSGIGHLHQNLKIILTVQCSTICSFLFENAMVVETGRTDLEIKYIVSILLKREVLNNYFIGHLYEIDFLI